MDKRSAAWSHGAAAAAVRARDIGGLVRAVRQDAGMTLGEVGAAAGRSSAAVSRFERGLSQPDNDVVLAYCDALRIPRAVVGVALGFQQPELAVFARQGQDDEEDAIDRRAFLRTASLIVPAVVLEAIDRSLARPAEAADRRPFAAIVREVRDTFNAGRTVRAVALLPTVFARADEIAQSGTARDLAAAASAYDLATEMLAKIDLIAKARVAADRSQRYASRSEQPVAQAASARCLSIVLRHDGSSRTAMDVTGHAAQLLATAGLTTSTEVEAYTQALATHAYTSARAGLAADADTAIAEAADAARCLPATSPAHRMSPAAVSAYEVGVRWALHDPGSALRAAEPVDTALLPTAERRARFHTDVARAHHAVGRSHETAVSLSRAARESQDEILCRPEIRLLARTVLRDNPRLASSARLRADLGLRSA